VERLDRSGKADMPVARTALTALILVTSLLVAGCGGDEPRQRR